APVGIRGAPGVRCGDQPGCGALRPRTVRPRAIRRVVNLHPAGPWTRAGASRAGGGPAAALSYTLSARACVDASALLLRLIRSDNASGPLASPEGFRISDAIFNTIGGASHDLGSEPMDRESRGSDTAPIVTRPSSSRPSTVPTRAGHARSFFVLTSPCFSEIL